MYQELGKMAFQPKEGLDADENTLASPQLIPREQEACPRSTALGI